MGATQLGRVLVSGALAGLVVNVGEFILNALVLRGGWEHAMQSLGRPPISGAAISWLNLMGFALGTVSMWLYAVIRPSARTHSSAVTHAALASWLLAYVLGFGWSYVLGVFPAAIYVATVIWSLFELLAGTFAGAWLYQRKPAPSWATEGQDGSKR